MKIMNYQPKLLVNKTDKTIEFMCGGAYFVFAPREQKILDGFVAHHALHQVNTGLIEVGVEKEIKMDVPLDQMTWSQLRKMTDKKGNKIYQMGMNRKQLEEEIKKCLS